MDQQNSYYLGKPTHGYQMFGDTGTDYQAAGYSDHSPSHLHHSTGLSFNNNSSSSAANSTCSDVSSASAANLSRSSSITNSSVNEFNSVAYRFYSYIPENTVQNVSSASTNPTDCNSHAYGATFNGKTYEHTTNSAHVPVIAAAAAAAAANNSSHARNIGYGSNVGYGSYQNIDYSLHKTLNQNYSTGTILTSPTAQNRSTLNSSNAYASNHPMEHIMHAPTKNRSCNIIEGKTAAKTSVIKSLNPYNASGSIPPTPAPTQIHYAKYIPTYGYGNNSKTVPTLDKSPSTNRSMGLNSTTNHKSADVLYCPEPISARYQNPGYGINVSTAPAPTNSHFLTANNYPLNYGHHHHHLAQQQHSVSRNPMPSPYQASIDESVPANYYRQNGLVVRPTPTPNTYKQSQIPYQNYTYGRNTAVAGANHSSNNHPTLPKPQTQKPKDDSYNSLALDFDVAYDRSNYRPFSSMYGSNFIDSTGYDEYSQYSGFASANTGSVPFYPPKAPSKILYNYNPSLYNSNTPHVHFSHQTTESTPTTTSTTTIVQQPVPINPSSSQLISSNYDATSLHTHPILQSTLFNNTNKDYCQSNMYQQNIHSSQILYSTLQNGNYYPSVKASEAPILPANASGANSLQNKVYTEKSLPPPAGKYSIDLEDQINSSKIPKSGQQVNHYGLKMPQANVQESARQRKSDSSQSIIQSNNHPYYNSNAYSHNYQSQQAHYQKAIQSAQATTPSTTRHFHPKKQNLREYLQSWKEFEEEEQVDGMSKKTSNSHPHNADESQVSSKGNRIEKPNKAKEGVPVIVQPLAVPPVQPLLQPIPQIPMLPQPPPSHHLQPTLVPPPLLASPIPNVPTIPPKMHVTVDNGNPNLPDIVIDIEKTKGAGGEGECFERTNVIQEVPKASEKLYILNSIEVPLTDLNKYRNISVVNKLPENIVLPPPPPLRHENSIPPMSKSSVNSISSTEESDSNHASQVKNDFEMSENNDDLVETKNISIMQNVKKLLKKYRRQRNQVRARAKNSSTVQQGYQMPNEQSSDLLTPLKSLSPAHSFNTEATGAVDLTVNSKESIDEFIADYLCADDSGSDYDDLIASPLAEIWQLTEAQQNERCDENIPTNDALKKTTEDLDNLSSNKGETETEIENEEKKESNEKENNENIENEEKVEEANELSEEDKDVEIFEATTSTPAETIATTENPIEKLYLMCIQSINNENFRSFFKENHLNSMSQEVTPDENQFVLEEKSVDDQTDDEVKSNEQTDSVAIVENESDERLCIDSSVKTLQQSRVPSLCHLAMQIVRLNQYHMSKNLKPLKMVFEQETEKKSIDCDSDANINRVRTLQELAREVANTIYSFNVKPLKDICNIAIEKYSNLYAVSRIETTSVVTKNVESEDAESMKKDEVVDTNVQPEEQPVIQIVHSNGCQSPYVETDNRPFLDDAAVKSLKILAQICVNELNSITATKMKAKESIVGNGESIYISSDSESDTSSIGRGVITGGMDRSSSSEFDSSNENSSDSSSSDSDNCDDENEVNSATNRSQNQEKNQDESAKIVVNFESVKRNHANEDGKGMEENHQHSQKTIICENVSSANPIEKSIVDSEPQLDPSRSNLLSENLNSETTASNHTEADPCQDSLLIENPKDETIVNHTLESKLLENQLVTSLECDTDITLESDPQVVEKVQEVEEVEEVQAIQKAQEIELVHMLEEMHQMHCEQEVQELQQVQLVQELDVTQDEQVVQELQESVCTIYNPISLKEMCSNVLQYHSMIRYIVPSLKALCEHTMANAGIEVVCIDADAAQFVCLDSEFDETELANLFNGTGNGTSESVEDCPIENEHILEKTSLIDQCVALQNILSSPPLPVDVESHIENASEITVLDDIADDTAYMLDDIVNEISYDFHDSIQYEETVLPSESCPIVRTKSFKKHLQRKYVQTSIYHKWFVIKKLLRKYKVHQVSFDKKSIVQQRLQKVILNIRQRSKQRHKPKMATRRSARIADKIKQQQNDEFDVKPIEKSVKSAKLTKTTKGEESKNEPKENRHSCKIVNVNDILQNSGSKTSLTDTDKETITRDILKLIAQKRTLKRKLSICHRPTFNFDDDGYCYDEDGQISEMVSSFINNKFDDQSLQMKIAKKVRSRKSSLDTKPDVDVKKKKTKSITLKKQPKGDDKSKTKKLNSKKDKNKKDIAKTKVESLSAGSSIENKTERKRPFQEPFTAFPTKAALKEIIPAKRTRFLSIDGSLMKYGIQSKKSFVDKLDLQETTKKKAATQKNSKKIVDTPPIKDVLPPKKDVNKLKQVKGKRDFGDELKQLLTPIPKVVPPKQSKKAQSTLEVAKASVESSSPKASSEISGMKESKTTKQAKSTDPLIKKNDIHPEKSTKAKTIPEPSVKSPADHKPLHAANEIHASVENNSPRVVETDSKVQPLRKTDEKIIPKTNKKLETPLSEKRSLCSTMVSPLKIIIEPKRMEISTKDKIVAKDSFAANESERVTTKSNDPNSSSINQSAEGKPIPRQTRFSERITNPIETPLTANQKSPSFRKLPEVSKPPTERISTKPEDPRLLDPKDRPHAAAIATITTPASSTQTMIAKTDINALGRNNFDIEKLLPSTKIMVPKPGRRCLARAQTISSSESALRETNFEPMQLRSSNNMWNQRRSGPSKEFPSYQSHRMQFKPMRSPFSIPKNNNQTDINMSPKYVSTPSVKTQDDSPKIIQNLSNHNTPVQWNPPRKFTSPKLLIPRNLPIQNTPIQKTPKRTPIDVSSFPDPESLHIPLLDLRSPSSSRSPLLPVVPVIAPVVTENKPIEHQPKSIISAPNVDPRKIDFNKLSEVIANVEMVSSIKESPRSRNESPSTEHKSPAAGTNVPNIPEIPEMNTIPLQLNRVVNQQRKICEMRRRNSLCVAEISTYQRNILNKFANSLKHNKLKFEDIIKSIYNKQPSPSSSSASSSSSDSDSSDSDSSESDSSSSTSSGSVRKSRRHHKKKRSHKRNSNSDESSSESSSSSSSSSSSKHAPKRSSRHRKTTRKSVTKPQNNRKKPIPKPIFDIETIKQNALMNLREEMVRNNFHLTNQMTHANAVNDENKCIPPFHHNQNTVTALSSATGGTTDDGDEEKKVPFVKLQRNSFIDSMAIDNIAHDQDNNSNMTMSTRYKRKRSD